MDIKLLKLEDWQSWKELRLEALKQFPSSFGSSYEEERSKTEEDWRGDLEKNDVFGGFVENNTN